MSELVQGLRGTTPTPVAPSSNVSEDRYTAFLLHMQENLDNTPLKSTSSERAFCAEMLDKHAAKMRANFPANMRALAVDLRRADETTPQEREYLIYYLKVMLSEVDVLEDRRRLRAVIKNYYFHDGSWLARTAAKREEALS
jgi:hypothetical protein